MGQYQEFYPAAFGAFDSAYKGTAESGFGQGCGIKPACLENNISTSWVDECKTVKVPGSRQECKDVPYPCPDFTHPLKMCTKQVCVQVPTMEDKTVCVKVPKTTTIPNADCINKKKIYSDCLAGAASGGGYSEVSGDTSQGGGDTSTSGTQGGGNPSPVFSKIGITADKNKIAMAALIGVILIIMVVAILMIRRAMKQA